MPLQSLHEAFLKEARQHGSVARQIAELRVSVRADADVLRWLRLSFLSVFRNPPFSERDRAFVEGFDFSAVPDVKRVHACVVSGGGEFRTSNVFYRGVVQPPHQIVTRKMEALVEYVAAQSPADVCESLALAAMFFSEMCRIFPFSSDTDLVAEIIANSIAANHAIVPFRLSPDAERVNGALRESHQWGIHGKLVEMMFEASLQAGKTAAWAME